MKLIMSRFSLRHPWITLGLILLVTIGLGLQMPKVHFDNDPENMLSPNEPVRKYHHLIKDRYDLYDFVVVGIVNDSNEDGVFNVGTLGRIGELTELLLSMHQAEDGTIRLTRPGRDGAPAEEVSVDLSPDSSFQKILNIAFHHDPNRLFDEQGNSAIIAREIISPSVVDNIKQAELGSLKLEYLMEQPPTTREEALTIRDDAMANPLYAGTLVSEDQKAICLYLPITKKHFSYNVANLVSHLTADWQGEDQVYITGLPVAEDTFGVEMLVQMATSAPMAGLAIFLLMWLFFRRVMLIIAPMMVAMASIVMTMGLLIGLGYDVHIMSSMIAIFLMPIAVADAIHILSEFYDTYPRFKDKAKTIEYVVGHLFQPMLFTSLTTMVGFASLAFTPIPPVQVFGLHVAFGVAMAWLLTMTLIPAYIMLFVPEKALDNLQPAHGEEGSSALAGFMERVGSFSFRNAGWIAAGTVAILIISVLGILRIRVNDNPVKWFTPDHPIRVADKVLNEHFGGTYTAYLNLDGPEMTAALDVPQLLEDARSRFAARPELLEKYEALANATVQQHLEAAPFFEKLLPQLGELDSQLVGGWEKLADEINYLDPNGLDRAGLEKQLNDADLPQQELGQLLAALDGNLTGEALQEAALQLCDKQLADTFSGFTRKASLAATAPAFKRPEVLRYLEKLADHLTANEKVGKVSTAVDALKKAAYELQYQQGDGSETAEQIEAQNKANYAIPQSVAAVGQVFTQLEGMKKKDSLFHLISRDYQHANIWVQLKSGDNRDMESVVEDATTFIASNPPPIPMETGWAGLTYINVEWQAKMVSGMSSALIGSFIMVLIMMILLFRSFLYGLLAMVPLTATITFIYGLIGHVGKEYDMPIAVLSALTLGLSVDFAIHFLQRSREMQKQHGSWQEAIKHMFKEPAMAISRNAITISIGFTPLLLAPLVPYKTVGFFLATIMAVSWMATLFILAALVTMLRRKLFEQDNTEEVSHAVTA